MGKPVSILATGWHDRIGIHCPDRETRDKIEAWPSRKSKPSLELESSVHVWLAMRAVLLAILGVAVAITSQAEPSSAFPTTVCDIKHDPGAFDGKMVRLRAVVESGFEIFGIRDPEEECLIGLEYSGGGPVASVSFGAMTPSTARPAVRLDRDRHFRRFERLLSAKMYPKERGHICVGCSRYEVTATMVGRVDFAGEGLGFGHMNMFPARLVLQSVSDVSAKDLSSAYDPALYSTKKVRFPTGRLSGSVLAPEGSPVSGGEVNAISTDEVPLYLEEFTEWTDEKGRFKFELPPGNYVVGLNLDAPASPAVPFPPTYYPGTPERGSARVFSVADRQRITNVTIRLPKRLREKKIRVKAVWPDGRAIADANVWLAEVNRTEAVVGGAVSHTARDGTFELIGFEGIDYLVRASIYVKPYFRPHCAASVLLRSDTFLGGTIVMTFTKSGDTCRGSALDGQPEQPLIERPER